MYTLLDWYVEFIVFCGNNNKDNAGVAYTVAMHISAVLWQHKPKHFWLCLGTFNSLKMRTEIVFIDVS